MSAHPSQHIMQLSLHLVPAVPFYLPGRQPVGLPYNILAFVSGHFKLLLAFM